MRVQLAYGEGHLPIDLPDGQTTIIEPSRTIGLADERAAIVAALERPIGTHALRNWIKAEDSICIVFTDITRATPNERLIPWLLEYLEQVPGVKRDQITLLNALGTHRPNTKAELEKLLTPGVVRDFR